MLVNLSLRTQLFLFALVFSLTSFAGPQIHPTVRGRQPIFDIFRFSDHLQNGVAELEGVRLKKVTWDITISLRAQDFQPNFQKYVDYWKVSFDQTKLTEILQKMAEEREITQADYEQLKIMRKAGSALRNGFSLFHKKHNPPKKFEEFVKAFGKMNDLLDPQKPGEKLSAKKKKAEELLSMIENREDYLRNIQNRFVASSPEKFKKALKRMKREAQTLLDKKDLNEEQHHDLRKIMRVFMYHQLVEYHNTPTEANAKTYQLLFDISAKMGDTRDSGSHDYSIGNKLREKIESYLKSVEIKSVDGREVVEEPAEPADD